MVKKTIKYKDFNEQEREETFYFHLSKANLIELEARKRGGLKTYLERISSEQDTEKIWEFLSDIVLMSYGKKSDDGSRHIKNAQLREEFQSSEAFSELVVGLLGDPAGAAEFINGLIPHDLREQVMQMSPAPQPPMGPRPAVSEPRGETSDWNVFEKTGAHVPTESMKHPEPGALSDKPAQRVLTEEEIQQLRPESGALDDQPAARVLTAVEIREMDAVDLQRGLVEGRYKLPQ